MGLGAKISLELMQKGIYHFKAIDFVASRHIILSLLFFSYSALFPTHSLPLLVMTSHFHSSLRSSFFFFLFLPPPSLSLFFLIHLPKKKNGSIHVLVHTSPYLNKHSFLSAQSLRLYIMTARLTETFPRR